MRRLAVAATCLTVVVSGLTACNVRNDAQRRASTTEQPPTSDQRCVKSSELPSGLASLASSPDCATGFVVLNEGIAVAGTLRGNLAVAGPSGITSYPSNGTGPVTDLEPVPLSLESPTQESPTQLVAFAVGEGVGLFEPQSRKMIQLGKGHPLRGGKSGEPRENPGYIAKNQFILMRPINGRPHLGDFGWYVLTTLDGQEEKLGVFGNAPEVCFMHMARSGDVPVQTCTDIGDQLPPGTIPTPRPVPTFAPPPLADRCSDATSTTVDAAHRLHFVIGRDSIEPSAVTVRAGEHYVVSYESADPSGVHGLTLVDGNDRLVRDATGSVVSACTNTSGKASDDFVPADPGVPAYFVDPGGNPNQNLRVVVTVAEPAQPAATPADIAELTPVTSPSPVPTLIVVPGAKATPAPTLASGSVPGT